MSTAKRNSRRPVLLVGDLIIDVHHFGRGGRRSIEGGMPVATHERTTTSRGGAGLVVRNLEALNTKVEFFTAPTSVVKERFVIDGEKVLRWNRGTEARLSPAAERTLVARVRVRLARARLLVISDYRHGLLTRSLAKRLLVAARDRGVPAWVDSQVAHQKPNHRWYAGADLVLVNQAEAKALSKQFDEKNLETSLRVLLTILKAKNLVVKLAARGCAALVDGEYLRVPGEKVKAIDAVGAGDAFVAALAKEGLSKKGLQFANRWGALATLMRGTEPPKRVMLKRLRK